MPNGDMRGGAGGEWQVVNPNENAAHKFGSLPDFTFWLRGSPDGRALRFTVNESATNAYEMWEVAADGTRLHRLLQNWNEPVSEGNWTPDANYFGFHSLRHRRGDRWPLQQKVH